MSSKDKVRIGVIGLGFMGAKHLTALQISEAGSLAAVYSNNPKKLAGDLSEVGGNLGAMQSSFDFSAAGRYTEIDALLADPAVDAVDICLPTHLHKEVTLKALAHGKHVLVEKPMALNAADAEQMLAAAEAGGRVLMVGHVLRFWPAYRALSEALRMRPLGAVRAGIFRRRCAAPGWSPWLTDTGKSGGGVFDLLIHDVDMCLNLFGRPRSVSAKGFQNLGVGIDVISAQLSYSEGFDVEVAGGWHHPKAFPFSMEFTVVTDGATIECPPGAPAPTLYGQDGNAQLLEIPESDAYAAELEYFFQCCINESAPALCPPRDSIDAVRLMECLLLSRQRQGDKVLCSF